MKTPAARLETGKGPYPRAVLENGLVRAEVCPGDGGRLRLLSDLRAGQAVLAAPGWFGFPASLPMHCELREVAGAACAFLLAVPEGSEPSLTLCWMVEEGRAELTLQAKATNRTGLPQAYSPEWLLAGAWRPCNGGAAGDRGALALSGPVQTEVCDGGLRVRHGLAGPQVLPPWGVATATLRLSPLGRFSGVESSSRELAVDVRDGRVVAQASVPTLARLVLTGPGGDQFEAEAGLGTGPPFEAEAPVEVRHASLAAEGLGEVEWPPSAPAPLPGFSSVQQAWLDPKPGTAERAFLDGEEPAGVAGMEAAVAMRRAERMCREGDLAAAAAEFEAAAAASPECELAWWGLAHCLSALGEDASEALANAHRAGPLEPLLRAQAFLDAPVGEPAGPLLGPLAAFPQPALAALARLVQMGRLAEAARLADELLRQADVPLVRWVYAWCLLSGSRMVAEAASEAGRAAAAPLAPPLPTRPEERRAVLEAAARFPQLPGVEAWAEAARRTSTE